jgi:hypothetical protein
MQREEIAPVLRKMPIFRVLALPERLRGTQIHSFAFAQEPAGRERWPFISISIVPKK